MQNLQEAINKVRETGRKVNDKGEMLCAFHEERKPSARLWYSPYHNQVEYHCFGCGVSYKFETFYKMTTDKEYKRKAEKQPYNIDFNLLSSRLNAYFINLLEDEFDDPKYGQAISFAKKGEKYLRKRGLDLDAIKKYGIGLVMQGDAQRLEGIKENSWARDKTRYCFLTFPIRNEKGNTVTMQFEDFGNRDKKDKTKFNLGRTLPLWYSQTPDEESKDNEEWALGEGIYDAASFDMAGVKAIALLGQPSKKRVEKLKEFKHLLFALDNDEPGKEYKEKLSKELYPFSILREVVYPEGVKDPNQLLEKEGIDGIVGLMERTKEVDLFPPLIDVIDVMIEKYSRLMKRAIPIPGEFSYLKEFLPKGLLPGVYGLAGMPGVGKTTILNQLCDALAREEIPTVYFLTEEPAYRLIQRSYRKEGLSSMRELKKERAGILGYRRIFEMIPEYTAEKLKDILQGIKNKLEAEGKHYPIFILDSLQALRLGEDIERFKDTRSKTTLKTEYLSHIARDLEIPVIFTSFVAREYYSKKKDRKTIDKPTMSVFKEAGDIEYLIDVGLSLWIEKEKDLGEDQMIVELRFVKNRFGKYGKKNLSLIKEECKFEERRFGIER